MGKNYDFLTYSKEKRENSDLIKWSDSAADASVTPMWIADMDFETMPEIVSAIERRARGGLYGYTNTSPKYKDSICKWMKNRHGWDIDKSWIVNSLGVVFGFSQVISAVTDEGDAIIVLSPVYHAFFKALDASGRHTVKSELVNKDERFEIDFDDFEKKIINNNVKLFLMCSPHNPVGRVWTKEELSELSRICTKHGVFVISDEVHSDLVFSEHKHIPYLMLDEGKGKNSVICSAASKTFNLAGFQSSYIIVSDDDLRKKISKQLEKISYADVSAFGTLATETAYTLGNDWVDGLNETIEENYNLVEKRIKNECPKIKCTKSDGTFLIWLDCTKLGINEEEINDFFVNEAKVMLDKGKIYGDCADGFMRMNIGCPKDVVDRALNRIRTAYIQRGW